MGFREYPELIVVSGGGAGTTTLISHLSKFRDVNVAGDFDGLKHAMKLPRKVFRGGSRAIFITADTALQLRSLERRGTLRFQALKMGGIRSVFVTGENLRPFLEGLIYRQRHWFESRSSEEVLIIEYPQFYSNPELIAKWIGIVNPHFVSSFPTARPRLSSPDGSQRGLLG